LKSEVLLVRLVESSGIELKKHGKDYLGLCPFHDDKEPSLVISPDKNLKKARKRGRENGDRSKIPTSSHSINPAIMQDWINLL